MDARVYIRELALASIEPSFLWKYILSLSTVYGCAAYTGFRFDTPIHKRIRLHPYRRREKKTNAVGEDPIFGTTRIRSDMSCASLETTWTLTLSTHPERLTHCLAGERHR